ncbi:MAG TPA: hypothetical protein VFK03_03580 [Candidatus Saccharimonadales bacterium]|nr:hypothetical protein [Candidatus Saccharimonadales bacterium]
MERQTNRKTLRRAQERYLLIHKRPVGPKTAERLFFLYDELSRSDRPTELYTAGWAATEAGLVATDQADSWRQAMVEVGIDCWQSARTAEIERSTKTAERKGTHPSTFQRHRIEALLALAPALRQLPGGPPDKAALALSYDQLLNVAETNFQATLDDRYARHFQNHYSLAFEFNSLLACNRLLSKRLLALPTLARADDGNVYPRETHDIQILSLSGADIDKTTPVEVKSTLKQEYFERYDAALIGGHRDLLLGDQLDIGQTLQLFRLEQLGVATATELAYLEQMTDSLIHSIRHYNRSKEFGRHCLEKACQIPRRRTNTTIPAA